MNSRIDDPNFNRFYNDFKEALKEYPIEPKVNGQLNPELFRFLDKAIDTLESKDNILKWVECELKALGHKKVILALFQNRTQEVIDELVRLDHGIPIELIQDPKSG